MPNQAHSGIQGDPWHRCGRCGLDYRLSELAWQEGRLLCMATCWDEQTAHQRDMQLARIYEEFSYEPDMQLDPKLTDPDANEVEDG